MQPLVVLAEQVSEGRQWCSVQGGDEHGQMKAFGWPQCKSTLLMRAQV